MNKGNSTVVGKKLSAVPTKATITKCNLQKLRLKHTIKPKQLSRNESKKRYMRTWWRKIKENGLGKFRKRLGTRV